MKLKKGRVKKEKKDEFSEHIDKKLVSAKVIAINKKMIAVAKEYRKDLKKRMTKSEKLFQLMLLKNKVKYEFQKIIFITRNREIIRFFIADFYIPDKNIIVEIDGGYHFVGEQIVKDESREFCLRRLGYNIFRLKNEEVTDDNTDLILEVIK
jgi:very-short-patch-repair endonuclease|uniref:Endonuclease n=1 Tax=virus sp. ctPYc18 TaxID=2828251 RepID=A0A8S5RCY0_9VIRU|nr:MAG TPA: Endonuclease [virus sp. ctPYc18]